MSNLHRLSTIVLGGVLVIAPVLQARTCSGNGDLIGGYGWIASRAPEFVAMAATAPGTNRAYVLIPADVYERLLESHYDDGPWTPEERDALASEAAKHAGGLA